MSLSKITKRKLPKTSKGSVLITAEDFNPVVDAIHNLQDSSTSFVLKGVITFNDLNNASMPTIQLDLMTLSPSVGYSNATNVATIATGEGVGVGMTVDITTSEMQPGAISTITINQAGEGYLAGDIINITINGEEGNATIQLTSAGSTSFTLPINSSYGGKSVVAVMLKLTKAFTVDISDGIMGWKAGIIDTKSGTSIYGYNNTINSRVVFNKALDYMYMEIPYIAQDTFDIYIKAGMSFQGGNNTGEMEVYVMLG